LISVLIVCCTADAAQQRTFSSVSLTLFSKAIHKKIHKWLIAELAGMAVLLWKHGREVNVGGNE
jgi:hypothetical protein